jgi:ABC-type dipeptide/oligopeptide/nickel transport system permease subunit
VPALSTHRSATIGAALVIVLVLLALVGPLLAGDPAALDIDGGLSALGAPLPPSSEAIFGTDPLGRDVWSRVANGAGTSLWIAAVATALALVAGVAIGVMAGVGTERVDNALMRLVDLALAFPFLLLAILLAALFREAELASATAPVSVPLALVGWTTFARVIRTKARVLARSEFALAARAIGASTTRIVMRHLLPNLAGTIAVVAAFAFAQNVLGEAVLSYLGLGPPPPAPTWGRMLYEGRAFYRTAPWLVVAPGTAIVLAVVAFNLLGDGLRARFEREGASL